MESDFEMEVRQFLAREPFRSRMIPADRLALFCEALTHDSYTNERGGESYERLEFLGDAILEFVVCEEVYSDTDLREGAMTDFKQDRVANRRISERVLAYGLGIDQVMRVGGGHQGPEGKVIEENMRADSFEALLAAIYLTYGMESRTSEGILPAHGASSRDIQLRILSFIPPYSEIARSSTDRSKGVSGERSGTDWSA